MSDDDSFASALRSEIDAVVGRYEALVRALGGIAARDSARELEQLREALARASADAQHARDDLAREKATSVELRQRLTALEMELEAARGARVELEAAARAAADRTQAYEEEFVVERAFVQAAEDVAGSLFGEALAASAGRPIDATSASYAALKARGVEATLVSAIKERGRTIATAPLLERERAGLAAIARAAGCELLVPAPGTRFSTSSMEKAGTVSDPAEEGNVASCAIPGVRRAGTEGALVFPRVIVATG